MFNTIEIDRNNLTIMGVKFANLKTLESTANAIRSNTFEGFKPTPKGIDMIIDYVIGKIYQTTDKQGRTKFNINNESSLKSPLFSSSYKFNI